MKPQSNLEGLTPTGPSGTDPPMAKADEPPAVKHRDREEKLAAALRANLRRRKAEAGKPAPPGIAEREPDGS